MRRGSSWSVMYVIEAQALTLILVSIVGEGLVHFRTMGLK